MSRCGWPWAWSSPAGWIVAQLWIAIGASDATLLGWHLGVWVIHLFSVALLFIVLPVSTLVHMFTGPLNVFFSKTDRAMGQLATIAETGEGDLPEIKNNNEIKQLMTAIVGDRSARGE